MPCFCPSPWPPSIACCRCCRGQAAGVDTLFIAGGIHRKELLLPRRHSGGDAEEGPTGPAEGGAEDGEEVSAAGLQRLCAEHGARPTFATPFFRW